MYLKKISLINFKNYENAAIELSPKINCFIGDNGVGKTNLLDAIHYLSFCKSYFNSVDTLNILHNESFFSITGVFTKNGNSGDDKIQCVQRRNHRKLFKVNDNEYPRLADHIGLYPAVMVSPADQNLVTGGSDERRKFIDKVISQFDKYYLDNLINYNKALLQRNRLLKHFAQSGGMPDSSSLELWDKQLIKYGNEIFDKRKIFINEFIPVFDEYYEFISHSKENVSMEYESKLIEKDFKDLLVESLAKDRTLEYTTVGIHKDDVIFKLTDKALKTFGSQGQQKSFVLAIRLAQFAYTHKLIGFKPLMLFDDIFDKLDDARVSQLINLVSGENFGQVFITDTQKERIQRIFTLHASDHKLFEVVNGIIEEKL